MMILRNIKKKKKKEENFNTLFRVFVLCGLLSVCVANCGLSANNNNNKSE
jgi:hypothetical protein